MAGTRVVPWATMTRNVQVMGIDDSTEDVWVRYLPDTDLCLAA